MKMMKKVLTLFAVLACVCAQAQTTDEEFYQRYASLVEKVGPAGLGVETLVGKWAESFPDSRRMFSAKAIFYLSKSQTQTVVQKDQAKYLGEAPLMALKDSLGMPHNYFKDVEYDDYYFSLANKAIDQAVSKYPYDLSLRSDKILALLAYEKENPDMTLQTVSGLIDFNYSSKPSWTEGDNPADPDSFSVLIQEACFRMFRIASPACMEAFKAISEKMISYDEKALDFVSNLGSYYLVYAKDPKSAMKYYTRVLKTDPKNYTAIRNCVLASRRLQDKKSEKKYLVMLAEVTEDEIEKTAALKRAETL